MKIKKYFLPLLVIFLLVISCGSNNGDDNDDLNQPAPEQCDFDINTISNGQNLDTTSYVWKCRIPIQGITDSYFIALYEDGTGLIATGSSFDLSLSQYYLNFDWLEVDCRKIEISMPELTEPLFFENITYNSDSQELSFTSPDLIGIGLPVGLTCSEYYVN